MPKNKKIEEPEYIYEETGMEDKLKKAREKFKKSEKERKEYLDGWQRERADFANFKRDMQKHTEESRVSIKEDILGQFLINLVNLELLIQHAPKAIKKDTWYKGLEQVYKQYIATLQEFDIRAIEVKEGDVFDPNYHEAIEGQGSKISEVIQKGYRMGDKVIRPAKVKVSKK